MKPQGTPVPELAELKPYKTKPSSEKVFCELVHLWVQPKTNQRRLPCCRTNYMIVEESPVSAAFMSPFEISFLIFTNRIEYTWYSWQVKTKRKLRKKHFGVCMRCVRSHVWSHVVLKPITHSLLPVWQKSVTHWMRDFPAIIPWGNTIPTRANMHIDSQAYLLILNWFYWC